EPAGRRLPLLFDDEPSWAWEPRLEIEFSGAIWYWRGPSPFYFVTVPPPQAAELQAVAQAVTYGWGMIPVVATIGQTTWTTSLFPKDATYITPLKDKVRRAEGLDTGEVVTIRLAVAPRGSR
ncbi:MAG: DUF1905 domain-containing protein, partial [Dehalococcoidia bacterium]